MAADEPRTAQQPTEPSRRSSSSEYVRSRWPFLQPHIREAIITLVDAGLATTPGRLASDSRQDEHR